MSIDEVVSIKLESDTVDETRVFEVKAVEAPPIPLWKLGLILLTIIGGGTGAYYLTKEVESNGER